MILRNRAPKINIILFTNLIFAFFPISFIFGNFVTNVNLILFCCLGIFHIRSKIHVLKFSFALKTIFLFFLIIFFSTVLSYINYLYFQKLEQDNLTRLIKSVLFFRFFLLLIITHFLIELKILDIKYFFIFSSVAALLISLDVTFQYSFNYNIFGFESYVHHNTSFFLDERIAGGFIQNFSFFSILYFGYKLKDARNFSKIFLITIVVTISGVGILLSGNRMPLVLFLFGLFLLYFANKNLKTSVVIGTLVLLVFLTSIIKSNSRLETSFKSFYVNVTGIVTALYKKVESDKSETAKEEREDFLKQKNETVGHKKLIFTGIETWKLHKFLGNGIKSFREDCKRILIEKKKGMCSNHPHNYYLEVFTDLGLLGFSVVIILALLFIIYLIKNYKKFNNKNFETYFLIAATISIFLEFFPIKSSGSIFTTNNATYIIVISGIVLSHKKLLEKKT